MIGQIHQYNNKKTTTNPKITNPQIHQSKKKKKKKKTTFQKLQIHQSKKPKQVQIQKHKP